MCLGDKGFLRWCMQPLAQTQPDNTSTENAKLAENNKNQFAYEGKYTVNNSK